MSVKVISKDKNQVVFEVTMDLNNDNESFLETENRIMNKVNELGSLATLQAMENLDITERVIEVNGQKLYPKKN
jgi:hypothetical protein